MKYFLLIMILSITSVAQQLNREMKVDYLEISSKVNTESDKSLLLVKSEVPNLRFDSNRQINKVEQISSGEWKVWLPPGTHILKINADGFMGIEYPPYSFGAKKSYEMLIKAVGFAAGSRADDNLIDVVFQLNEENVYSSYGDFVPTLSTGSVISYKLPKGNYKFRFQKKGFQEISKDLSVDKPIYETLQLLPGENSQFRLTLPGIVVITSEPNGAEILINGQRTGNTPYQGELPAGKHQIETRKTFYYTDITEITIEAGKTHQLSAKLNPRFGYLDVTSNIPGSKVFLDDKFVSNAPLQKHEIESNNHRIRIEADLHHSYTEEFSIADGETKTVNVQLKPAYGSLEVTSIPESGADVILDGKKLGITPLSTPKLASGRYLIKVTKEFYNEVEEQIIIKDTETTVKNIVLNKNFGELNISAEQSQIFINGEVKGSNNFQAKLSPGSYKLKAVRDNRYYPAEEEVYLSIGDRKNIKLEPAPRMGSVSVFVTPTEASGAEIFINNEYEGTAPLIRPLLIGDYSITAKYSGFLDKTENISVIENQKQTLNFEMLTYAGSQKQSADRWGTIKWISFGTAALIGGASAYFHFSAQQNFSYYNNATTSSDAASFRAKVESHKNLSSIALYTASAVFTWGLISWITQSTF